MSSKNGLYIFAVNAGSSSLKTSLYEVPSGAGIKPKLVIRAEISGLFSSPKLSYTRHTNSDPDDIANKANINDAKIIFKKDQNMKNIKYVCHRVVHGGRIGENGPVVLKDNVEEELKKITTLAPL
jgi:acetate kinase